LTLPQIRATASRLGRFTGSGHNGTIDQTRCFPTTLGLGAGRFASPGRFPARFDLCDRRQLAGHGRRGRALPWSARLTGNWRHHRPRWPQKTSEIRTDRASFQATHRSIFPSITEGGPDCRDKVIAGA
jgi:hypothetical protein